MSPDGSTKPPPEEKLLRLIRGKGLRRDASPRPAPSGAGAAVPLVIIGGFRTRTSDLQWPKLAAAALGLVITVELLVLMLQLLRPLPSINTPSAVSSSSQQTPEPVQLPSQMPSLEANASRLLFTAPSDPASAVSSTSKTAPSTLAKLLASRLTLMGIMAGNPSQAIIEDSQTKKTYFLTPGQPVVEGAMLEQVLDNRVILDLDGEKIELTL